MRFPVILLLATALTAAAIPLHVRQEHAVATATELAPHGNATVVEPTGAVPEAKATGEAAAPASGEAGSAPGEAAGGDAAAAEAEAKGQEEITKNGLNAIYVVVSLVAIMAGCVFFSATSGDGNSEQLENLALIELDKEVMDSHGGVPTYNADGTLAAITGYDWNPERKWGASPEEKLIVEKEIKVTILHMNERRDFTQNKV
ncbi:hypothetical protein HDU98_006370 [Podochytrium sp. JEL0797]|nr:hypothetical protein HDU98_006370 [Podochytrium sp. JEL0797]